MTTTKPIATRDLGPFGGAASIRLSRMGLLAPDGKPDPDILPVFAGIFCAQFFDDMLETHDDRRVIRVACQIFGELRARREYEDMLVFLCIQYDAMRRTLPDPVWHISGNRELIRAFMDSFASRLTALAEDAGLLNEEPEVDTS
jgi:hypothetical protein